MNSHAYYSRPDVQRELVRIAEDREVQVWFGLDRRGRRPEVLHYPADLKDLIRKGMTSLHFSEERWSDPLMLKPGMAKKILDELRIGWDLVLDIDSKDFELSRITAELIVEAFKHHNVKDYTVKFSGNKGFHIGIPFESFPSEVNSINIKDYFPEGVRIIANFICSMIKDFLSKNILKWKSMDQLATDYFKGDKSKLMKNGEFNPFVVVDIDSVLISSRHMVRAPYSMHEKSGLVSVIVKNIKKFKKEDAKPNNIIIDPSFLRRDNVKQGSSKELLVEAFDWYSKNRKREDINEVKEHKESELPTVKVDAKFFPPCIQKLLAGLPEDGRKRGVFILINFLRHSGWDFEDIKIYLLEWNKKNYEPLRDGYIQSQIMWSKRQKNLPLPPNCSNDAYYKGMGICCEDPLCKIAKNPVNYMRRRLFLEENKGKRKTRKKAVK